MLRIEVSARGLLLAVLALLTLWALVRLWPLFVLVITAFIFMATLLPYVEWQVRHRIPRVLAVLFLLVALIAVLGAATALVVPAVVDEFAELRDNLPEDAAKVEDFLSHFGIDVELEERAEKVDWGNLVSGRAAIDYGQRALLIGLSLLTVLVITAYLLVDAPRLSAFVYQFVAPGKEPGVERWLDALSRVVGGYVRAQFITSIAIGVYTSAVLFAVGVPNAAAFGVLAAFADIIPLLGATIATVPPVVAALHESSASAGIVLVLLLIYQQFEDRYLTPWIYGSSLNLSPLIVLITILAGGQLLGIVGVLLALPAAAVGRVAMDYVLDRRKAAFAPSGPLGDILAPDTPRAEAGNG